MKRRSRLPVLAVIAAVVLLWIEVMLIDPSGRIFNTVSNSVYLILAGIGGLLLLFLFFYVLYRVVRGIVSGITSLFRKHAKTGRTDIFEEMLESLGDILGRAEFVLKRKEHDRLQLAEFTRGKLIVELRFDPSDAILRVSASSGTDRLEDPGSGEHDFDVECRGLEKLDHFKRQTLARLREWMVRKEVKIAQ